MIRGLYTAASGLTVQWERQEAIANNLANADTVGYKRDDMIGTSFGEYMIYAVRAGNARYIGNASSGSVGFETVTDYSPGELRQTGNPLDLALEGEGFFVVQTPQGERLTRNGDFTLDQAGNLVNHQGYPVLGENGPIVLRGSAAEILADGRVRVGGEVIDRLRVVKPQVGTALRKEGANLYGGGSWTAATGSQVRQGFLEGSNVQTVMEMVRMIEVSRAYEANQKVLAAHDSALEKAVNEVGRVV
jgi:flagellar basal-body rod protein FlgF